MPQPACLVALLVACVGLISAGAASAAPFCVAVQGLPDQCLYVDGHACQTRAAQLGGVCVANAAEVATPPGARDFCLVDGGRAVLCLYSNRPSCEADATRRHGACVQATPPPEPPGTDGVDPFQIRRPY